MKVRRLSRFLGVLLMGHFLLPGVLHGQAVVRVETVTLQPHEIPAGWRLVSQEESSEVLTRIVEVQMNTELTSVWTQTFDAGGRPVEIEYLGGLSRDSMAKAYSEISLQKRAEAVCHRGRFAIGVRAADSDLVRTAFRALWPDPLDRIKILGIEQPVGQRTRSEVLANRIQRESLGKHLGVMPVAVLNQFFEGPSQRQITYVACATVDDASAAYPRVKEMSGGKSAVLREANFLAEIYGDSPWVERVRPAIESNLVTVVEEEAARLEAIRQVLHAPTPTNTPTKLQHLR